MKVISTLLLGCFIALNASALDPAHFTITRVSAPYFIVDGNSPATINKAYVGFEVTNNSNSAVTYTGLKFTISSIGTSVAGQNYAVVSPASGMMNIGTLAPGASKVCYFFVSYPAQTAPQATFNIVVSDNTAGSKAQSFVIRNRSSISANAGGTATQTFINQDIIGGIITDDVTYVVGNVQNGDENDFQVSVAAQFDPSKMTLLSTKVIASSVPGIPAGSTDSLYFLSGNGSNGATVTVRWTFRISGYNFTSYILPCAGATSGSTNYKYALNTSLGTGAPITISAAANPLLITKTSDRVLYVTNSAAVFTVRITNPGLYGITIDKIVDQLPAGFVFQGIDAGSYVTAANSTSVPATGGTGTIIFEGGVTSGNTSYYVAAGSSIELKYLATSSAFAAFNLSTSVKDYVGDTEVGVAVNLVSVTGNLPVTLLSFNASDAPLNRVRLDWSTSSESNTHHFEIEKNRNNRFDKIGEVHARGGASLVTSYSFVDSSLQGGKNQYRLKAVDTDGRYQYSNIVSIDHRPSRISIAGISPNPYAGNAAIRIHATTDERIRLQLTDMAGRIITSEHHYCKAGSGTITVEQLGRLVPGTYLLVINYTGGEWKQKIVIK
jgi:hypothetical protein